METPLLEWLLNCLFPQRCVFCGRVSGGSALCCRACNDSVRFADSESCISIGGTPCYSVFRYSGHGRRALGDFKFRGRRELADYFADEMVALLGRVCPKMQLDAVTYLPMPDERQQNRGYNQAELLAAAIAKQLGVPCQACGLYRTATFAQHDLHLSMRSKQQGAGFAMVQDEALPSNILLVDDLCTSGNSLRSCIALLEQAGASKIVAVTAFRAEK